MIGLWECVFAMTCGSVGCEVGHQILAMVGTEDFTNKQIQALHVLERTFPINDLVLTESWSLSSPNSLWNMSSQAYKR